MTEITGEINIWLSLILALLFAEEYRNQGASFKYFTLFLVSYAGIQWAMHFYVVLTGGNNNLVFFGPYMFLQFITLSLFYKTLLQNKKVFYVMLVVVFFLIAQYIAAPSLLYKYNTIGITLTQSIIIIYSMIFMYRSLTVNSPFRLINLGVFLYFVASTLVFASGNFIFGDEMSQSLHVLLYNVKEITYILFQVLILIELWRNFYRVKTS